MARNYYRILGVAPYSEDVVIQAAYRALMRRYHPDTNNSPDAEQRAAEINAAYEVLSNPAKRARYDAELKAAQRNRTSSSGKSSSARPENRSRQGPPPPPPPPPQPNKAQNTPPKKVPEVSARNGWIAGAVILGFIVWAGALGTGMEQASSIMNVDENVATDLSLTENIAEAAVTNETAPQPVKLSNQSETPVQFADIEEAAARFARTLTKNGIAGARAVSERCHEDVLTAPSWSGADQCAAFDFAAAYVDRAFAGYFGTDPLPYFQFQAENQADRYEEAGAYRYSVGTRLNTIKDAAEKSAEEAVRIELARRRPVPPQPKTPEREPSQEANSAAVTNTNGNAL